MRMDSEMIGILLSDSMHYTIVVSLEMSDEPIISIIAMLYYDAISFYKRRNNAGINRVLK